MNTDKEIFSSEVKEFLETEMKICLKDLREKIIQDAPSSKKIFNEFLEMMIAQEVPYEYSDELGHINNEKNKYFFAEKYDDFIRENGLSSSVIDSKETFILDNLRHAFTNFSEGGVLNMYQLREAEGWYPKVIIDRFLGIDDDIYELEEEIIIYRGTSKNEFESNNFGQSWTISKDIAEGFAFEHYNSQPEYSDTLRVVLKGKISKEFILYYSKDNTEDEVIVIPKKLKDVEIIEERISS